MTETDPLDRLMSPAEVANVFKVDSKTVTRWAKDGKLGYIRTPGNHRRYRYVEVMAFLNEHAVAATNGPAAEYAARERTRVEDERARLEAELAELTAAGG